LQSILTGGDCQYGKILPSLARWEEVVDNIIGVNIQKQLEQRGMSRKELCKKTGLTEAALSRYITGAREPKANTLLIIARGLGVHTDELLGTPSENPQELDDAVKIVARSSSKLTAEQKKALYSALLDSQEQHDL
jgi:transcriptional regulator with XRE-family HTH domain